MSTVTEVTADMPSRFRLAAPSRLEIHAEREVQRFLVTSSGGYFPILAALPSGRLVACVREGDFHVGQRGRLAAVLSDDGGESWGYPISIDPRGPDDRNAAFGALPDGTLLCAFYRFQQYVNGVYQWSPETTVDVLLSRSSDGGETWSPAAPVESLAGQRFSAFGRMVVLSDGAILL
ncbi:MAG TPA: sialidase family protein, partial [Chloroflexota bacterium]|nr:sialidase family protein [Chloroflexota bacterium]